MQHYTKTLHKNLNKKDLLNCQHKTISLEFLINILDFDKLSPYFMEVLGIHTKENLFHLLTKKDKKTGNSTYTQHK